MKAVARGSLQDIVTTNEGCTPITTTAGASTDVFVAGFGVHRLNDSNTIHPFGPPVCPVHQTKLTTASTNVKANNKGVGRKGDLYLPTPEQITTVNQDSVFAGDL
jgi:uncharacterized Zn-binding protein involved in type VI secretion